jgi:cytosine/adenosine deaminase-related metal-dependent hydrolase
MISHISATYVYPIVGAPIKNGVLAVNSSGVIEGVFTAEEAKKKQLKDIVYHEGLLVPGFINTHCHLELSNLHYRIRRHTGLPEFAKSVIRSRTSDEYEIELAMLKADKAMFENGIAAVGDISNQLVSRSIKNNSPLHYHTFLEIMGFNPDNAKTAMERALKFKEEFDPLPVSIVPHAPYSVSVGLFNELSAHEAEMGGMLSIHNQESAAENAFFENKTGDFVDLFEFLGQDISFFKAPGTSSLRAYLPLISSGLRTLLVHNTYTTADDVSFASAIHPNLYWCLCPNANLYIENKLPDVNMFRAAGLRITLGTDSLASNTRLSILAEMNLLQEHFEVPTEELLQWATLNGADFLGLSSEFGSFETGKRPGVNLLSFTGEDGAIILGDKVKRLF